MDAYAAHPIPEPQSPTTRCGVVGTLDAYANVCALVCAEEAGFVTGQVIAVDGGSSLMNPDVPLALSCSVAD